MRQLPATTRNLKVPALKRNLSTPSPLSPGLSSHVTSSIRDESNDIRSSSSKSENDGFNDDGEEKMKFTCDIICMQSSPKVATQTLGDEKMLKLPKKQPKVLNSRYSQLAFLNKINGGGKQNKQMKGSMNDYFVNAASPEY